MKVLVQEPITVQTISMLWKVFRLIEFGLVFAYTLRPNYTGYLGAKVYTVVGEYNILLYKLLRLYKFDY